MSYYPPPNPGQDYSVAYYPPSNPYGNEPPGQYNMPGPFPTDQYGPPGSYPPPQGQYGQPGSYPPSQGQYGQPGSYPPPQGQYGQPGSYPPPQGQYGQPESYPPPQGQYGPPGAFQPPEGQYPPPGQPYAQGYGYGGDPIVNQPMQQGDWTSIPQHIPNCPPGLECLISLSNLFVKQKVELLEVFTGFETNNKFTVKNDRGDKLFWAVEESDICSQMCFERLRPFDMRVMDAQKQEVIRLSRLARCTHCCFPCCLQVMEVYSPPGNLLGTIEQDWSLIYPWFSVKDASGMTVLKMKGPFCALPYCGQAAFQILSRDGEVKVGKISKDWSGFARELFTDADYFGISFPGDLDVRMKAVMLGAVFLIDAMYFEH